MSGQNNNLGNSPFDMVGSGGGMAQNPFDNFGSANQAPQQ